ncbi:lysosomal cobalamin transporter ABCD4-like [Dysidea avara]|uniref:lysosomal cobalamin transporter ABCD4-like n=1 Tax=Dysidea avara TaxID=196820 RepID=UPI003318425E
MEKAGEMDEQRIPLLVSDSDTELQFPEEFTERIEQKNLKRTTKRGFDLLFLKRFFMISKLMFPCLLSKTLLFFLFLIFVKIAEEVNISNTGRITGDFYLAIDTKNRSEFKRTLLFASLVTFFTAVCKSASLFVSGILHVRWRGLITKAIHNCYFIDINYFVINSNKDIDNPDQRITQDVDRFCDQLSQAMPDLVIAPLVVAFYTYQTTKNVGYESPLLIFGFFLISTVLNKFLISPIASLVFKQEAKEGDFRFHHVQVRNKSESLALYRGGSAVLAKGDKLLQKLLRAMLNVVHWSLPLNLSINIFDYLSTPVIFGILGLEVLYFDRYAALTAPELAAAISENTFFSLYLLNSFSRLTDLAVNFSDIAGYTHRIGELLESLEIIERSRKLKEKPVYIAATCKSPPSSPDKQALITTSLSLAPPGWDLPLIRDLNFVWKKDECVLLYGPVGSGKSSLVRVFGGLWQPFAGFCDLLVDIGNTGVMFLPQQPFLITGSLTEQIIFPHQMNKDKMIENDFGTVNSVYREVHWEERLTEAVRMAALVPLRDRIGGMNSPLEGNWYNILSPGQMQQVAFARLFYHRPPFAILDEASSFLSEKLELEFYTELKELGITFLSVGHRSSLNKFHDHFLSFDGSGDWTYK